MDWAWWPSAGAASWDWSWRAYPGVWLLVLVPAVAYAVWLVRARRYAHGPLDASALRLYAGLGVLWLALDWPLGALAAGHLLAARATQFLLVTLLVAPLVLSGLPDRAAEGSRWARLVSAARYPLAGALAFAAVLLVTHVSGVVDAATPSALGSSAVVLAWLAAALLFWWPLVGPGPDARRLTYLASLVYLVVPFVLPKGPGIVYAFSAAPLYEPFADDAGALGLSPLPDQQFAGFLYWIVGSVLVLGALGYFFFRWYGEDRRMATGDNLALPADPRAVSLLFQAPGCWAALETLLAIVREALPPARRGADLAFAYRSRGGVTQVVLELRVALDPQAEHALAERVEREFDAWLARLEPERRALVMGRLAFRLLSYGARVR